MARFTGGGQVGAGSPPTTLVYTRIDSHVAAAPEATYTFSPASTLLAENFSDIITIISGNPTASFALGVQYNTETGNFYDTNGARVVGGVETIFGIPNQGNFEMIPAALIDPSDHFAGIVHFPLQDVLTGRFTAFGHSGGFNGGAWFGGFGHVNAPLGEDFSRVTLLTSASTWATGTKIDTFAVAR